MFNQSKTMNESEIQEELYKEPDIKKTLITNCFLDQSEYESYIQYLGTDLKTAKIVFETFLQAYIIYTVIIMFLKETSDSYMILKYVGIACSILNIALLILIWAKEKTSDFVRIYCPFFKLLMNLLFYFMYLLTYALITPLTKEEGFKYAGLSIIRNTYLQIILLFLRDFFTVYYLFRAD